MQAIKEMPLESYEQLERTYGEDLERICGDHENLIQVILTMEEELIQNHRQHIDDVVDIVKQDMSLLQNVEEPQSDIEEYVDRLDSVLLKKMDHILGLRS